ncbi:MAG: hypothetical protein HYZ39_22065 [Mycolicibacterium cosmeticum]|nr:hypothetical protein [Mycolicibacterium cosmeticum]
MSTRPRPPSPPKKNSSPVVDAAVEAVGSQILTVGQALLTQMKDTLGEGDPDDGQAFGAAADRLRSADAGLGAAALAERWTGAGSDAYADQNSRQRLRAESVADTDHEVHRVLAGEAFQVGYHRRQIDELYNWLGELSEYTQWLDLVPRYGDAAKLVVETAAVNTAVTSAGFELANMHHEASENAGRLKDLVGRYQAIAATAELPDTGFGGPAPGGAVADPGHLPAPPDEPGAPTRGGSVAPDPDFGPMGGAIGVPEDSAPGDAGQQGSPAALAGPVGIAGMVPALAAALTTPLGALLAPAGGLVAAAVQAAVQAAREQQRDTEADDGAAPGDGHDAAVPDGLIQTSAQDSGTDGSGTATVSSTGVSEAATQPSGR